MSEVNRLEWDAYIRDSELMNTINRIERRVGDLSSRVVDRGREMENVFSNLAKAAAGFLTLNTAQNFIQQLIKVRSEFQQLDIAFTTMLGSKEKADKLTKDLIEFAGTTPFGMKETANAAKQLLAYGSTAENVKNELRMLGDVAAGTSQPIGDLVYLYGTLRTQGRAYLMDIRQFAGRGIPIYKELANVLKINESQVNDFVSAGKVGFAEVQQAFQNMTATGSMFGGLMEAQSRTIQGELERLGDAYDQMLNKIGTQSEGMISNVIQGASVIIENYEKVLEITSGLIVVYGAYRAALIATAALQQLNAARVVGLTTVELLHYGAIVAKTAAMRVLNAVMLASPVVAMTAGITVLVGVIYSLTQVTDATTAAQEKLNEAHESGASKADQEKRSIEQLVAVLKDNTATAEQKKVAYDKLQSQTKGILLSYSQEEIAIGKATKSLDDYILKIREATSARKAFDEFNALAEDMDKLNRKGIEGVGTWTKLGRSIKNTFIPTSQGISFGDWANGLFSSDAANNRIVAQEKEVRKKSMDELKKEYGDKWNEILTGVQPETKTKTSADIFLEKLKDPINNFNSLIKSVSNKSDLDNLKKAVTEKLEALAPGDTNIATYKKKLEQIAKLESQYSISGKKGTSTENSVFQEAERYNSIQLDLEKAKQQRLNNQLTRDQQEVQSVKDKYNALREEVRKFNADPRNKVKVDGKVIDDIEKFEVGEVNTKIDNKYIVDNLSQQKGLYDQFEAYKLQVGEEKAKKRFQNDLNFSKTYLQLIEEQMSKALEIDPTNMTAAQKESLESLTKLQQDEENRIRNVEDERYISALKSAQNLSDKLLDIEKEYQEKKNALKSKNELTLDKEQKLQKELMQKYFDELESSDEYQKSLKNIDESVGLMIGNAYQHGKDVVFNLIEGIKGASQNQKAELKKVFGKFFDDGIKDSNLGNLNNIAQASMGFTDLAKSASDFAFGLSDGMETLQNMVSTAGQLAGAMAGLSKNEDMQKSLQSAGSYFAIFGAVVSLLSGITKSVRGASQVESKGVRDQLDYQNERQLKSTEAMTKMLERQLELMDKIYGAERLEKYGQTLKQIEDNYADLNKQLDGRYLMTGNKEQDEILSRLNNGESVKQIRKQLYNEDVVKFARALKVLEHLDKFAKSSSIANIAEDLNKAKEELAKLQYQADLGNTDDYTVKLIDQLQNQIDLYTETVNKLKEETTGNSFSSILSDLSGFFFDSGLDSADAWSKGFDSVMKNYAIQKFSRDYLEKAAQDWYDLFDQLAEGGINDTEKNTLKDAWDKIQKDGQKRVDELGNIIGKDNSTGLTGSIKRELTEASASELTGLGRNGVDLSKRILIEVQSQGLTLVKKLDTANKGLIELNQINVNTANTVVELKNAVSELQQVNKNLGGKH